MLAALVLAFGGGGGGPEPAEAGPRPNFVIVVTDDQDITSMEVMRKVRKHLTRQGTSFENFYATLPACCPSRATLVTGQYAHNHGVKANQWAYGGGFKRFQRSPSYSRTVNVALQKAGYRTGWVGKYLNGYGSAGYHNPSLKPPGWSSWYGIVKPDDWLYGWRLNENGRIREHNGRANYQTDVLAGKAAGFIRSSTKLRRPFFLTVAPGAPHGETGISMRPRNPRPARRHWGDLAGEPLPKPPNFNAAPVGKPSFARRKELTKARRRQIAVQSRSRRESMLAVDDMVARLVNVLRQTGKLRSTYVIFTSDNGFLMGEHRLRGKRLLYEPSAKVPLVIRGPGVPRGKSRRQVTGNIDLASTVLHAAGVRPLVKQDGISLLPLARDPHRAKGRGILLTHASNVIAPLPGQRSWRSRGVRVAGWVYVEHRSSAGLELELYDLESDPHQLENLIRFTDDPDSARFDRSLAQKRRELRRRLVALDGCAGAGCR